MKVIIRGYVLKKLEYDGLSNVSALFDKLNNEDEDRKELSLFEEIKISSEYYPKKTKLGMLVSSDVNVISTEESIDVKIFPIIASLDTFINVEFQEEDEKYRWMELDDEKRVEKITPAIEPIIYGYVTGLVTFLNSNNLFNSNSFEETKIITIDGI